MRALRFVLTARFGTSALRSCESCAKSRHTSSIQRQKQPQSKSPDWFSKSTFAIAPWRGDAQRYWLEQVLEGARVPHDQWLQNPLDQRASLKPTHILGDRKLIPEAVIGAEMPKSLAGSCIRHGYCAAELIIRCIVKQLILHRSSQCRRRLTPPKVPPSTLDQASKWLEDMQRRLNLCIKTKQNVHPRPLVVFMNETLSAVIQYHRTIGNIWDSLYNKRQMRDSDMTLDRIYIMLSEFLLEVKLSEEQDKLTQRATGASGAQMSSYSLR